MNISELLNTISKESIDSLVNDIRKQRQNKDEIVTTMIGMKDKDVVIYISSK